jgi:hypothetical protein
MNMPLDPSWSQTISAISSVVIGLSAVVIAYRNLRTSSRKLEFDMFKPRYEVYQFTLDYLNKRIRGGKSPEVQELDGLKDKIDLAKWLFDDDIVSFLNEIESKSIEQKMIEVEIDSQLKKEAKGTAPSPVLEKIQEKLAQNAVDFQDLIAAAVTKKFDKYMLLRR